MAPGRILAAALAGAVALLLLVLWLALHEPWLGAAYGEPRPGDRISARDGASFEVPAGWLVETPSYFIRYAEYNAFVERQRALRAILDAPQVEVARSDGTRLAAAPVDRPLAALPAAFWYQLLYALLGLSVGAALIAFRPGEAAARWFAAASFGFFVGTLMRALYSSRTLVIDAEVLRVSLAAAHGAVLLSIAAMAGFAWHFPRALAARPVPAALLAFAALAWLADTLQLAPTTNLAYRAPLLVLAAATMAFALAQWHASRRDPVRRVLTRWMLFALVAAPLTWAAGLAVVALGYELTIPRGTYGVSMVLLLYLGMALLILRRRAFELERWWFEAWIWFLGGALVVALDLLLVYALSLHAATALAISLAVGGWLYFPLRQWLLARLWRRQPRDLRELFPELVRVLLAPQDGPGALEERWGELLRRVFEPRAASARADAAPAVRIEQAGLHLVVPQAGGAGALVLEYADGGARLFSRRDARLAQSLLDLLRRAARYRDGYLRGAAAERERIARDLHDDIGAKLLTLIHESSSERVSSLARSAVAEMREVVAGLRAQPLALADALADWRAELAQRCAAAGCTLAWRQPEQLPPVLLTPRQQLNLARVLREATSNALRHARARALELAVRAERGELAMEMRHDGEIAEPAQWREGTGIHTMRRRTADLGGRIHWTLEDRRLRLALGVPLGAQGAE